MDRPNRKKAVEWFEAKDVDDNDGYTCQLGAIFYALLDIADQLEALRHPEREPTGEE